MRRDQTGGETRHRGDQEKNRVAIGKDRDGASQDTPRGKEHYVGTTLTLEVPVDLSKQSLVITQSHTSIKMPHLFDNSMAYYRYSVLYVDVYAPVRPPD